MAVEFLLLIIVVGIVAGLIVRGLILGRKELNNPAAIISTALCGILGAFLTTWIGQAIGWYRPDDQGAGFIAAIIGAVLAGSTLAWLQRPRQARRDAEERAAAANEKVAVGKKAAFSASAQGVLDSAHEAQQPSRDKAAPDKPAPPAEPEPRRTRIFISYRREGDAALAGRIADLLRSEFGADHVFMDVDAMRFGFDFVEIINEEVAKCDVLLAVMGRNWLDAQSDDGQRRLDNPEDFVRLEIAAALKRKIPVVPILVDGTKVPPADRLPEELKGFARRNALDLRNASFRADMDRLVQQLKTSKRS